MLVGSSVVAARGSMVYLRPGPSAGLRSIDRCLLSHISTRVGLQIGGDDWTLVASGGAQEEERDVRIYNVGGRLTLGVGSVGGVDVETVSGGMFPSEVQPVYEVWDAFSGWARNYDGPAAFPIEPDLLGPPVPRPPQVFGVGLNYRDHAAEAGLALPERPVVFTKFPASVTGPQGAIARPAGSVDFEAELVAVIGRRAERVPAERAWDYIAGLTVGQDLSERELQTAGPPAAVQHGQVICRPPLLLEIGDELVTWVDGIGEMRHQFVTPLAAP